MGIVRLFLSVAVFLALLVSGCAHNPDRTIPMGQKEASLPPPTTIASSNAKNPDKAPPEPFLASAESGENGPADEYQDNVKEGTEEETTTIADPLEPFNRAMFLFNDRFYFWVLKPVAQGYSKVVPEGARVGVNNFFSNLRFPIRFVSCLLQADFKGAATEAGRFGINTTVGIIGFMDPASTRKFNLQKQDTDLGLTLAFYGVGYGFYIDWPVLGPSSPRDSAGMIGDYLLDPVSYISPWYASWGVRGYETVNDISLRIGDYESLKQAAIDPYLALRDAYVQYRQKKIKRNN
jgi:phospholipid-binding lipoprotein MlaA